MRFSSFGGMFRSASFMSRVMALALCIGFAVGLLSPAAYAAPGAVHQDIGFANREMEVAPSIFQTTDSLDNAGIVQIGDGLLQFLVEHAQAEMVGKYPDLVTVEAGNPMEFNELAFSKEKYIKLLSLDDGGVNVKETPVSAALMAADPLFFKCPDRPPAADSIPG